MKREIKFRGKEKCSGLWRCGFLLFDGEKYYIIQTIQGTLVKWIADTNTIGQFTGLTDKNGKEIYDKDIVGYGDKGVFMVCYNKDCCQFEFRTTLCDGGFVDGLRSFNSNIYVVLGNVFDNPELMK